MMYFLRTDVMYSFLYAFDRTHLMPDYLMPGFSTTLRVMTHVHFIHLSRIHKSKRNNDAITTWILAVLTMVLSSKF